MVRLNPNNTTLKFQREVIPIGILTVSAPITTSDYGEMEEDDDTDNLFLFSEPVAACRSIERLIFLWRTSVRRFVYVVAEDCLRRIDMSRFFFPRKKSPRKLDGVGADDDGRRDPPMEDGCLPGLTMSFYPPQRGECVGDVYFMLVENKVVASDHTGRAVPSCTTLTCTPSEPYPASPRPSTGPSPSPSARASTSSMGSPGRTTPAGGGASGLSSTTESPAIMARSHAASRRRGEFRGVRRRGG